MFPLMSESVDKLAAALSKVQAALRPAKMSGKNPHYQSRYADLDDVIEAGQALLAEHGLAVHQGGDVTEHGHPVLVTTLMHASGQWVRGRYPMAAKDAADPQKLSAAATYARRVCYKMAVGVRESDDDGNAGSGRPAAPAKAPSPKDKVLAEIWPLVKDLPRPALAKRLKDKFGKERLPDLSYEELTGLLAEIRSHTNGPRKPAAPSTQPAPDEIPY